MGALIRQEGTIMLPITPTAKHCPVPSHSAGGRYHLLFGVNR